MKETTKEWVRKAEDDYRVATQLSRNAVPTYDAVCFHCQQCAEKYLKAILEEVGVAISKTHDLEQLQAALLPHYTSLRSLRQGLRFLTGFAVPVRYPGLNAKKRQAVAAPRWAGRVRLACRTILGLPMRQPRQKKKP